MHFLIETTILFEFGIFHFDDQGHCLSTINPLSQGHYGEDISNAPTFVINPDPYHIPPADDKTISTEGCFSCKVSQSSILKLNHFTSIERTGEKSRSLFFKQVNGKGRHRRDSRSKSMDQELSARRNEIIKRRFARSAKRHHHGEEHVLKISLRQTRHRMRIIKLQPAVKVRLKFLYRRFVRRVTKLGKAYFSRNRFQITNFVIFHFVKMYLQQKYF